MIRASSVRARFSKAFRPRPNPRRTLVVFAPGTDEGRKEYFAALDKMGIEYEVGLQVDSHKRAFTSETIDLDNLEIHRHYERYASEWQPKEPSLVYWDHEPHGWLWNLTTKGFDMHDRALMDRVKADLRDYRQANGITTPLGFYGLPVSPRERAWTDDEIEKIIGLAPMLAGFDWIMLDLYARGAIVNRYTESAHRDKIRVNYQTACKIFAGRPVIPMVYLNAYRDEGDYGRVYFDEFNKQGIDRVAMWANPNTDRDIKRNIEQLEQNAPYIRAWQRGGK